MKLRMTGSPEAGRAFCGSSDDLEHDAMAAHALLQATSEVRGYYPESAFPESGESLDCKSASMARHTCNNIEKRAAEILAGWMGDRG